MKVRYSEILVIGWVDDQGIVGEIPMASPALSLGPICCKTKTLDLLQFSHIYLKH